MSSERNAKPPMTPPAIAPACEFDDEEEGSGASVGKPEVGSPLAREGLRGNILPGRFILEGEGASDIVKMCQRREERVTARRYRTVLLRQMTMRGGKRPCRRASGYAD